MIFASIIACCFVILICLLSLGIGYFVGSHKLQIFHTEKQESELTDEEMAKIRRARKELENFWTYNGDIQKPE